MYAIRSYYVSVPDYPGLAERQLERLARCRASRDESKVAAALSQLSEAARGSAPLMEVVIEAVRVRATLGEISNVFRECWGVYRP